VILPHQNEVDLAELPEDARKQMEFVPVRTLEQALATALPVPVS
jgi:ATP-dependent Lon protease